ncbi:MAG TPA: hypothetical protein VMF69_21200 [Gemmataceae bacterium]|nr:hypothetical protein [Gemmataceae bacterium]
MTISPQHVRTLAQEVGADLARQRDAKAAQGRQRLPVRVAQTPTAESLVGEFNARVKSRQKYWDRPAGAEAILQLRAAVLSEDGRLERYVAEHPGSPYRRRARKV